MRKLVEEELEGDWVAERDFTPQLFIHDEEAHAPAVPGARLEHRTATARSSTASSLGNVVPQKQEGFSAVTVKVTRGDLTPEQFRGLAQIMRDYTRRLRAHDRAAEPDAALGPQRGALRRLAAAARARPRRRRRRRDHRRRQLPGHRQLQARHHELDGPQRGRQGAPRRDGDRGSARQADPHQDERLPERLQPAPHREHRLLRRVDQGRRAHDPGLRRRTSAASTRAAPSPTASASRCACPPSACPRRSSAGSASTSTSARTARSSTPSPSASARRRSRTSSSDLAMPVEFGLENMNMFIDWNRSGPFEVIRGEGECAI